MPSTMFTFPRTEAGKRVEILPLYNVGTVEITFVETDIVFPPNVATNAAPVKNVLRSTVCLTMDEFETAYKLVQTLKGK